MIQNINFKIIVLVKTFRLLIYFFGYIFNFVLKSHFQSLLKFVVLNVTRQTL